MLLEDFLFWMIAFGLLLILASMAINGLYITTRGQTETLPNGKKGDINDMIFYPLLKFVMRTKGDRRVYYSGDELVRLQRKMLKKLPLPPPDSIELNYLKYNNGRGMDAIKIWQQSATDYLDDDDIKLDATYQADPEGELNGYGCIMLYKEFPIYYLPKIIRKPLLECIKCMASIWGTVIFWPVVLAVMPFHYWLIPIWILFCFCLSFLNTYFYNKT